MDETVGLILIGILVWIVIWFIAREVMCWYWKVNKIISLLESIDQRLTRLTIVQRSAKAATETQ